MNSLTINIVMIIKSKNQNMQYNMIIKIIAACLLMYGKSDL